MGRSVLYRDKFDLLLSGNYVPPVTCEVDPSGFCQNHCSWCYYKGRLGEGFMAVKTFANLMEKLRKAGTKSITFTGGGEPLLNPRFGELVDMAIGFRLGLITNGILLDSYLPYMRRFDFVRVSLDAATEETYRKIKNSPSFRRVLRNIESCADETVIGVSFVVCDDNRHEMDAAQLLATKLGAEYIQFKPETSLLERISTNHGAKVTNRYKPSGDAPCKIAAIVGIVTPNGDAYFCCQKRGLPEYVVGNVNCDSLEEMWLNRSKIHPSDCHTCRYMNHLMDEDSFPENEDFL